MDIQQVKLDYIYLPYLRKLDMIKSQSVKIMFCSDDEPVIDIGLMHVKHQNAGYPGLKYHYVIKNNGTYDGAIYYCRPRIYQNDISGQADIFSTINLKGNNSINNSISVCLAGATGTNATDKQAESFVNLCIFLMSQESLPFDSIQFLGQITGVAEITNWQDLIAKLKIRLDAINSTKNTIEIPTTPEGVKDISQYGIITTTIELNTFAKISKQTGIPESILLQMNKYDYGTILPPDTSIFIPKGPFLENLMSAQQSGAAAVSSAQLDSKVNYAEAITRGKYGQPNTGADLYGNDVSFLTTEHGGKKGAPWEGKGLDFPGYHGAFIQITDTTTQAIITIPFLISPSSSSESRSTSQQMTKTNAGWFIMRTGKNPSTLSLSGYMLDAKDMLEKHEFLENYKKYIEDTKNVRLEYTNPYTMKVRLEGRDYHGYIQSISFNKAATQPYLYQYNISFLVLSDKMIYDARQALRSVNNVSALIGTGQSPNVLISPQRILPGATPKDSIIYGPPAPASDATDKWWEWAPFKKLTVTRPDRITQASSTDRTTQGRSVATNSVWGNVQVNKVICPAIQKAFENKGYVDRIGDSVEIVPFISSVSKAPTA